jgi:hypothetical protein
MVNKDQSIIMQVAANIACDLVPKGASVDENIVAFDHAYAAVCEIILTSQGFTMPSGDAPTSTEQADIANLQRVFPEATPTNERVSDMTGFQVRIKGRQHGPIPQWLVDECAKKGVTEVWDNRDGLAANPKRPWFKSTTTNDAFWEPKRK